MRRRSPDGGVSAALGGGALPEEYPTDPPSLVLNGAIFGLWGLRDAAVGLDHPGAAASFDAGVDTLAANIERWDTGSWSRYDLYPHPVTNVASPAYHALHILQLEATQALAPRDEIGSAARRFARYAESTANRTRAVGHKVLFRFAVPRSRRVAGLLPWGRA
jgi:heparosan-N-sulfate-glucuronate 5-epimerase